MQSIKNVRFLQLRSKKSPISLTRACLWMTLIVPTHLRHFIMQNHPKMRNGYMIPLGDFSETLRSLLSSSKSKNDFLIN